jgi:hypothetical protein
MSDQAPLNREDAVIELLSYDHCFIDPTEAEKISEAFGFKCRCYTARCDYIHPKGLTFVDGRKESFGIAAEVLAQQVCQYLNLSYPSKMGRGFQLRACCDAITDHLGATTENLKHDR